MTLRIILWTLSLLAFGGNAWSQAPIVIKFSHVVAPDTPKGRAAEKFRLLAEERTGGRVRVEVYPNSQLYKDREELEALQLGAVQMLAPSLSKFGPLGIPEFQLFDLPYVFPNKETLHRVMDGDIGRGLLDRLGARGILGLAFWDNGFKQMSANRPLRSLADFRDLKMRIQPSRVLDAQMKALGAMPQPMAFSEVYSALRNGAVDGTENPVSNFYTQRMNEVQKHLTISDHGYLGYAVIVNQRFWQGLPPDLRGILTEVMKEVTDYEREISQRENDAALEAVRKAGTTEVYVLPHAGRVAWQRALAPVQQEFERTVGAEILERIRAVALQVETEPAGRR